MEVRTPWEICLYIQLNSVQSVFNLSFVDPLGIICGLQGSCGPQIENNWSKLCRLQPRQTIGGRVAKNALEQQEWWPWFSSREHSSLLADTELVLPRVGQVEADSVG